MNSKYIQKILCFCILLCQVSIFASSHREAPLISNDPLADNVDLYAFKSPDNPNMITIIATYVPMQLPQGGPNYYGFGENIRYEIHVDNNASIVGDEVTYRFTFHKVNQDPTTFFNIRLGQQNLKTTYTMEKSLDNGMTWTTVIANGVVPPNNIGPRSIESGVGLGTTYNALFNGAITTASTGEMVFAGPTDDPFFVDLGGIFDLGDAPRQVGRPVDGLACMNVSAIAIQIPISSLLKAGAAPTPSTILDSDYIIGVWASASRKQITTLSQENDPNYSGDWVQVSRLGMPLTNEAVIPVGHKDYWNSLTPYQEIAETTLDQYFYNPELALYMDDDLFGGAVPSFSPLRIQKNSLGAFDFTNGADGLFGLKGSPAVAGTALDDAIFGTLLLPGAGKPRSVDLWPAFHTGVPNLKPYQLATGKGGNPLAEGKPFVNNFLPNGGDMLRLNMAVPATPRNSPSFSSLGLINAAVLGLTTAPYNTNSNIEFIPNMDGFPNGRRLEDDVTRIELQAVSGVVLAAIGLWYDDYNPMTSPSPVTQKLLNVLTYTTGVESNDKPFTASFPYLAQPNSGTGECGGDVYEELVNVTPVKDFFVSSNTSKRVGKFTLNSDNTISSTTFINNAVDADGIFYDEASDVLIQLNRSTNVLDMYKNVVANINNGIPPVFVASSTSNFSNGREIAVSGNNIVVIQDAAPSNSNINAFVLYTFTNTGFTYNKTLLPGINLWGAEFDCNTLYAVEDNSNRVVIYNNIISKTGSITADKTVSVTGLGRTHGITYSKDGDVVMLTDIGDANLANDGGFIVINSFDAKAADNVISMAEQIKIIGPTSTMGNPVDIAIDQENGLIHVAERAAGGGKVLTFDIPTASGDIAPINSIDFAGASAIYLGGKRNGKNETDGDDDGSTICNDCNDSNNTIKPGATELCDAVDNDCDGLIDEGCPPPTAVCGNIITVSVNPSDLIYNGPGASDVYLSDALNFDGGTISSSPSTLTRQIKRTLTNIAFNWTTNGACIDATPNGVYNNNDKGIVYRDCLPVAPADFNKIRNFEMTVTDAYGTSTCSGRYKIIYNSSSAPIFTDFPADKIMDTETISIYPNPGFDDLNILLNTEMLSDDSEILIMDIFGKVVHKEMAKENNFIRYDAKNLLPGSYSIKLKTGNKVYSTLWVKM